MLPAGPRSILGDFMKKLERPIPNAFVFVLNPAIAFGNSIHQQCSQGSCHGAQEDRQVCQVGARHEMYLVHVQLRHDME